MFRVIHDIKGFDWFRPQNFNIYSGLKPSLVKKALTFVGHDNGVSQTYCVRLPGEEQAQQLKEALDQEIESVTAKENKEWDLGTCKDM